MGREFLLEVGSEEIPARSMKPVLEELKQKFEQMLADSRLSFSQVTTLGSARRLIVHVTDLAETQQNETVTTLGPPEKIAFVDGEPSKALLGFAKKSGVAVEAFQVFETERGRYMGFESQVEGHPASEILSERIPELVGALNFAKTMYWDETGQRFARPVRWVVALHGSQVVPMELYGIGAGSETAGHRVIGKQAIAVTGFDDYLEKLDENGVIASQHTRLSKVETELEAAAKRLNGRIIPDLDLLEEVVYINEYPTVIAGEFEERFLVLPREILITVMKKHQKYFALETGDGQLLPVFLAVINTRADPKGTIQKGHERVLRARLSDALFFWEVDGKQTLEDRLGSLDAIVFHNALGTYGDKVRRMMKLADTVNRLTGSAVAADILQRVVRCSKTDLTTGLVGEFPELQGIVGGLYARREGAPEEVAAGIYDQYHPAGLEDTPPRSPSGVVLSLADRLDTVLGCFSVGLNPTGSEDPLALRRHTQGVIKILLDYRLPFSLQAVIDADGRMETEATDRLRGFYEDRLRFILSRRSFAYDEINATLAVGSDSPTHVLERLEALHEIRGSADFLAIAAAFKRIKNILKQSPLEEEPASADSDLTDMEPEEAALAAQVETVEPQVRQWVDAGEYAAALSALASLRPAVDAFFDKILVMHEDPAVRRRRLRILKRLFETFLQIADISEVVVST